MNLVAFVFLINFITRSRLINNNNNIRQVKLIVDVLGGYSKNVGRSVRELLRVKRGREVLHQMQKGPV